MKKEFTKNFLRSQRGCYTPEILDEMVGEKKSVCLDEILESEIPFKDKVWFIIKKCEITDQQIQAIDINIVETAIEIFKDQFPNSTLPQEILQSIKDFLDRKITLDQLNEHDRTYKELEKMLRAEIEEFHESHMYPLYLSLFALHGCALKPQTYGGDATYDVFNCVKLYKGDKDYHQILNDRLKEIVNTF